MVLLTKKSGVIDRESVDEVLPLLAMGVLFQNIQILPDLPNPAFWLRIPNVRATISSLWVPKMMPAYDLSKRAARSQSALEACGIEGNV